MITTFIFLQIYVVSFEKNCYRLYNFTAFHKSSNIKGATPFRRMTLNVMVCRVLYCSVECHSAECNFV
jgi:hypothetical protein